MHSPALLLSLLHSLIPLIYASSGIHQTCISPHQVSKALVQVAGNWFV